MAGATNEFADWQNSVLLVGRVSSTPQEIALPSGEALVRFRIVVPRAKPATKTTVDTIDCVSFKAASQRKARTLGVGDIVEITGEMRRRFWKAGPGVASRVEVEISGLKSVK